MPPQWGGIIFYVILTAVMVWIWQEATQQVTYRTIAYSEFKAYLERGEVLECSVKDTEISRGPPRRPAQVSLGLQIETQAVATTAAGSKAGSEAKPTPPSTSQTQADQTASPSAASSSFAFRAVRVDDPDLVRQLEKAGVKFTGVKPGITSQVLLWIVPIALILLLWQFFARRMQGVGQSVLRFWKQRRQTCRRSGYQGHFQRRSRLRGSKIRAAGGGHVPEAPRALPVSGRESAKRTPAGRTAGN